MTIIASIFSFRFNTYLLWKLLFLKEIIRKIVHFTPLIPVPYRAHDIIIHRAASIHCRRLLCPKYKRVFDVTNNCYGSDLCLSLPKRNGAKIFARLMFFLLFSVQKLFIYTGAEILSLYRPIWRKFELRIIWRAFGIFFLSRFLYSFHFSIFPSSSWIVFFFTLFFIVKKFHSILRCPRTE